MAKRRMETDPLRPTTSEAEWTAQGWADEPTELTAARRLEAAISLRLGPDDAVLLRRAARLTGRTKSEFVRRATVAAARRVVEEAGRQPTIVVNRVGVERVGATTEAVGATERTAVTSGSGARAEVRVG